MKSFLAFAELVSRFGHSAGMVASVVKIIGTPRGFTMPVPAVVAMTGINERTVCQAIQKLQKSRYLIHVSGGGKTGHEKVYKITCNS